MVDIFFFVLNGKYEVSTGSRNIPQNCNYAKGNEFGERCKNFLLSLCKIIIAIVHEFLLCFEIPERGKNKFGKGQIQNPCKGNQTAVQNGILSCNGWLVVLNGW